MSGGVDSAAAAQLALDGGRDVVAVTLELWSDPENDGEQQLLLAAGRDGRTRAGALDGPSAFHARPPRALPRRRWSTISSPSYAEGGTPNPCVRCNGLVRFDAMLEVAAALGAAKLATGHYARITADARGSARAEAVDPRKDQSYVLARLEPDQLERLDFPLGELQKPRVRELARAAGLPVADKRESQDLCFLAGTGGQAFMRRHGDERVRTAERGGDVVDVDGRVLGRHRGHHGFTVGQRRGLGIAATEPLYVLAKDAAANRVIVGPRARLATRSVRLGPGRLHRASRTVESVRLRYHSAQIPCAVRGDHGPGEQPGLDLALEREVGGAAPGQTAVLMDRDRVVGWAPIAAPEFSHG